MTNDELARCRYLVRIPANPAFASLNIAMAVQIMAYELYVASRDVSALADLPVESSSASAAQMQGLFDHLLQAISDIGFADPRHANKLMQRLKRLFQRASPEAEEINILRGILTAVDRSRGDEE